MVLYRTGSFFRYEHISRLSRLNIPRMGSLPNKVFTRLRHDGFSIKNNAKKQNYPESPCKLVLQLRHMKEINKVDC